MNPFRRLKAAVLTVVLAASGAANATLVLVGAVPVGAPAYLPALPAGTFLVPVIAAGARSLQFWQFDLLFDNSVVEQLDPFDGSVGIYGAEFTPGDTASRAFILGGFAFNGLGLIDDVAGFYPALADGVSGDGTLAYLLFAFLPGRENADPLFRTGVDDVPPSPIPEPATLALVALCLISVGIVRSRPVARRRAVRRSACAAPPRLPLAPKRRAVVRAVACASWLAAGSAMAQTPASGPYYATPSWDQTLPAATRFVVLANMAGEAVLDRETGLVWERSPDARYEPWLFALARCEQLYVGTRMGWRLPTTQELATLVDFGAPAGALVLPPGHPFVNVQPDYYWSGSTYPYPGLPSAKSRLRFSNGQIDGATMALPNVGYAHSWCVRTPYGIPPP